ncbi:MAG: tyrosine-type recombinase/integrase [Syntrophobacteraceae bacterium]
MSPGSLSLDAQNHPIRRQHPPSGPARVFSPALHQPNHREYLDKLIDIFRYSELPGKEHAEQYLLKLYRKNCRPNTLELNHTSIKFFLKFVRDQHGITHPDQVTRQIIEAFIEHEQDRGLKPVSVNGRLISVYAFLGFLAESGVVHPDVLRKKLRVKVPEALPRAIEPEDIKSLLAVIDHVRDRAMILMLLRTGMRIGELLDLRVSEIDLKERKVIIYEAQKTRVGRVAYFSDDGKEALTSWLKARNPNKELGFYGQGRNSLTYAAARKRFEKYIESADLSAKGYTIHCLRHTFASELLNAGMRLECLQHLLGHTSLEVTRRYARLTDKTREEEYFRAMTTIEKGAAGGHYRFDHKLQKASEEEELLTPNR